MGVAAVVDIGLEDHKREFKKTGKQVIHLKPQKKPTSKSAVYPESGGKLKAVESYPTEKEFSQAMKLVKMTPKSLSIQAGGGGVTEITMFDVAAALSVPCRIQGGAKKLSKRAYYFGLAKYLDDQGAMDETIQNAAHGAIRLAVKHKWKTRLEDQGKDLLREASKLALVQHINYAGLFQCGICDGAGITRKGTCNRCQGCGVRELSDRALGEYIGTDHKNYKNVWSPRIDEMYKMINRWDQELLDHLYFQFRKEDEGQGDEI